MDGFTEPVYPRRRRRGVRWWQLPLLPITFPFSLLVIAFERLRRFRLWKVVLVFMVVWTAYGQLVVLLDPQSGDPGAWDNRHVSTDARRNCDLSFTLRSTLHRGPLGLPWVFVLACETEAGRAMLTRSGLPGQANWVWAQYIQVIYDYRVQGRISSSYLFMGLIAVAELLLGLPWLIGYPIVALFKHLHISWR